MSNYLFVCAGNAIRSPFAEEWFRAYTRSRGMRVQVGSAGLYCPERDERWFNRVNVSWLHWADRVIVMEERMLQDIGRWWPQHAYKVVNIDVPDIFSPACPDIEIDNPAADVARRLYDSDGLEIHFGPITFGKILEANLERILLPCDMRR